MNECVSYVVPVYNGSHYLAECLRSILAQGHAPAEVIVVDDGSTDDTPQVAASFGSDIRYVRQENGGHGSARNHGAAIATGEFLAFLDADDVIAPAKTAIQLARFRERPELQLCDAYCRNFWSPEIADAERWPEPRMRFTHGENPRGHSIITWLLRRELFDRVGTFNETKAIGEDADWYERMHALGTPIETVPQVLARRRLHRGNVTLTRYDEYLRVMVRLSRSRIAAVRHRA
jgi:glycosyltransferase involved in cell wall biosynthesis